MATLRNMLVLMRAANLPTVWSNLLAGWVLAITFGNASTADSRQTLELIFNSQLLLLLLGGSGVYVAGMIMNDIFDWGWDREHRPERPLASGRVSLATAKVWAWALLIAGSILLVAGSASGARVAVVAMVLTLNILILIYNRWHKGVAWAPYVMGLCRFMLPLIGFMAAGPSAVASSRVWLILFIHATSLWLLTVSITLLARHETRPTGLTSNKDYLLLFIPVPLLAVLPWNGLIWVSAVGYWLWVLISNRRHPLPVGVGGRVEDRLAAFPFIDAMTVGMALAILSPLVVVTAHAFILACFVLVLIGRRFVPVT